MTEYISYRLEQCRCSAVPKATNAPPVDEATNSPPAGPAILLPKAKTTSKFKATQQSKAAQGRGKSSLSPPIDCPVHNLQQRSRVEQIAQLILRSKRCLVVTGAGISCSAGIPDFRSGTGLFTTLRDQHGDHIQQGRDLFDAQLFNNATTTRIFHQFIGRFKQSIQHIQPTPTHQFLQWLHSQGRLHRWYTQNIDGLEAKTGLPVLGQLQPKPADIAQPAALPDRAQRTLAKTYSHPTSPVAHPKSGLSEIDSPPLSPTSTSSAPLVPELPIPSPCSPSRILRDPRSIVVPLHGDLDQLVCPLCSTYYPFTPAFFPHYQDGEAPVCPHCDRLNSTRLSNGRRPISVGRLRPNIVLYNEPHPSGDLIAKVMNSDVRHKPDLLLIMGTRLNVYGCKALVKSLAKTVHQHKHGRVVMVNLEPLQGREWEQIIDIQMLGRADDMVRDVLRVRDSQTCLTQFWPSVAVTAANYPEPSTTVSAGTKPLVTLKRKNSDPCHSLLPPAPTPVPLRKANSLPPADPPCTASAPTRKRVRKTRPAKSTATAASDTEAAAPRVKRQRTTSTDCMTTVVPKLTRSRSATVTAVSVPAPSDQSAQRPPRPSTKTKAARQVNGSTTTIGAPGTRASLGQYFTKVKLGVVNHETKPGPKGRGVAVPAATIESTEARSLRRSPRLAV
ncbi:NAD-dependent deacetylase hst3 [Dimargaris verticillata]|uniref:NAD-dependent deacetylase hst3 n=1 Tax=Dimargaris verticillata TaxID=2761393 RepID=A0A9W8B5J0_9FUNG|nr:NAD-dependent deacetylase hst3 [Dimargaris verticillata]